MSRLFCDANGRLKFFLQAARREPVQQLTETLWQDLYDGLPTGFQTPPTQRDRIDATWGKGASAYGEITTGSAATLLRWLAPTAADRFYDLGSGIGRLVLQAACTTDVGCATGIELAEHRHAAALAARARLLATRDGSYMTERLTFLQGDLRTVPFEDATLIYVGATCFPNRLVSAIAARVGRLPALRQLVVTRPLVAARTHGLIETGQMDLDMTWTERVRVHVYARQNRS